MIEIDGVSNALGMPFTEAGDYSADEYLRLIDLSTSPKRHDRLVLSGIASATRRLNRNLDTVSVYLVEAGLTEVYNDVVGQLNQMNEGIDGVDVLKPITPESIKGKAYSSSFRWE